ncbi:MAG: efflux RND transporter periplasmic adaptor subunit [Chryseobacterium sp.]|jgi:cobalt-zinc-cadmium efflux system membrane fusion protein|uniref:efflux RND transporter periplasmic adaptor subunit n=1 Tax=Chryseobacterium sp. TaxID=1871047 RepID=UPI0028321D7D|nr:efflux RND transporter periplasmic adaptor subunit [Chryseobacterium sp.]MDR2234923.1 efflux RND transporter periplasmic adaptor subunit [Chryseobacterium sp.]
MISLQHHLTNDRQFRIQLIICFSVFILFFSCREKEPKIPEKDDILIQGKHFSIPENNPVLKKIVTESVTEQDYSISITSAGAIETIPTNYAEIASPFSGRVIRSFVSIGQRVHAGAPVFEILSPGYSSVQKDHADALNEVKLAEKNYRRQQDLVRHGVGIQKELDEAETEYKNKKASLASISSALNAYNSKGSGSTLIIKAPISGEIISNKTVTGQYLREDSEPLVVIAELSKIWISGAVKEKDIRFIHTGDPVSVKVNTYPDMPITGTVYHINGLVDEATRSISVLIQCDNPDRKLKPGMFAAVTYSSETKKSIAIPAGALMQQGDRQYVWIRTGRNEFTKRTVVPGETSEKTVQISSGLRPGDIIITQGGIYMPDIKP